MSGVVRSVDALGKNVIKIKYFVGRLIANVGITHTATFLDRQRSHHQAIGRVPAGVIPTDASPRCLGFASVETERICNR
jgi:hypothetical protein